MGAHDGNSRSHTELSPEQLPSILSLVQRHNTTTVPGHDTPCNLIHYTTTVRVPNGGGAIAGAKRAQGSQPMYYRLSQDTTATDTADEGPGQPISGQLD